MATYIAVVRYGDGHLHYALFYSTDSIGRALYASMDDADAAKASSARPSAPTPAPDDEEPVSIHPYELYDHPEVVFRSRASRSRMWVTGPTSSLDAIKEADDPYPWRSQA
jgi:hypothetical protein